MPLGPIPVTVIGGYLGAGKTTLLNRMLRADPGALGERLAVLVNDFGSVSVDAALIESADGTTIRMSNGCVCCSLAGGFVEAMERVAGIEPRPDRLVVETSGVADPAAVAEYAHLPGFELDAVVVIADAETVRRKAGDALVGRHVVRQLAGADVIVLNKVDLVDDHTARTTAAWIGERAPGVPVVPAVEAGVPLALLLGSRTPPARATERHHHHGHEHPDVGLDRHPHHLALTVVGASPIERSLLERALDGLGPDVVRAKGFVELLENGRPVGNHLVQRVGTRCRITARERAVADASAPDAGAVALVVLGLADSDVVAAARRLAGELGAAVIDTTGAS